jgi:hypothetical protein
MRTQSESEPPSPQAFEFSYDDLPEYARRAFDKLRRLGVEPLTFHVAAWLFPWTSEDAYRELRDDIAANGLRQEIVKLGDVILDGRTRYIACIELGVNPVYKDWDGKGEPLNFVVSQNLHRRHLRDDQRAAIAAVFQQALANQSKQKRAATAAAKRHGTISSEAGGAPKQRARTQAAKALNVSEAKVRKAEEVGKSSPKLLEEVKSGKITLAKAHAQTKPLGAEDESLLNALRAVETKLVKLHPESMDETRLQALATRTQPIADFHSAVMERLKELQVTPVVDEPVN